MAAGWCRRSRVGARGGSRVLSQGLADTAVGRWIVGRIGGVAGRAILPLQPVQAQAHAGGPDRAVDFALTHFKEPMRRAVVLALYTGRRSSDLIKMRWDDYDGSAIQVTQKKTGTRLWVPCHADLKVELTEWKRNATSVTILVNPASEQPWNRIGFSNAVRLAIKAHPKLKGYVFHGLRNASASLPAEAGCSALEIAAITGHMSLKNLGIYTRQADRRQRANAAIATLENYRRKT